MTPHIGKWIMTAGIVLFVIGAVIYFSGNKLKWLGHLPGDIRIEREDFRFYFPITSMLLLSLIANVLFRLIRYFK